MIHVATEIEKAQQDVRAFRVQEWKDRWQDAYRTQHGLASFERTPAAPEPTDKDINWPEPMYQCKAASA